MWAQFDTIAGRKGLPVSSAITEAAREYVDAHKDDPLPSVEVKDRKRPPGWVAPPDPFPPAS